MIDWISVDDVLYRWDGQEIVCETGVGYSTRIEGNHLDGLEINDSADNASGRLFIDFAAGTLAYEPFDDQPSEGVLHYSLDGNETEVSLSQLPVITTLTDVIADDDMDIWSSIANVSQVHSDNTGGAVSFDYLDNTAVLDGGDNTLDLVLQNIGAEPDLIGTATPAVMLPDLDTVYLNAGASDPLDSLNFLNSGVNS